MCEQLPTPTPQTKPDNRPSKIHDILNWLRTIACFGIFTIAFAGAVIYGPLINATLLQAREATEKINALMEQINQADIPELLEKVEYVVDEAQIAADAATQTVQNTAQTLKALNLTQLNKAINDFAAVVQPLARLFGQR